MLQAFLTALALPPLLLVLLAGLGGWLAWRRAPRDTAPSRIVGRQRWGGALALAAALGLLLLATPMAAGLLRASLEREVVLAAAPGPPPAAIIILGGDTAYGQDGADVGPLSLERLRIGAALARRTGLPVLLTGGAGASRESPLSVLMAASLATDFGIVPRWIEPQAGDTHGNAVFSVAMLRASGISAAYVVTHAWHLPRALDAFGRLGFPVTPVPVILHATPDGRATSWMPRPDHWAVSWYALREWVGRLVYALRDGRG